MLAGSVLCVALAVTFDVLLVGVQRLLTAVGEGGRMNGVIDWFRDSQHWHGDYGVPVLLGQHAAADRDLGADRRRWSASRSRCWLGHRHAAGRGRST